MIIRVQMMHTGTTRKRWGYRAFDAERQRHFGLVQTVEPKQVRPSATKEAAIAHAERWARDYGHNIVEFYEENR